MVAEVRAAETVAVRVVEEMEEAEAVPEALEAEKVAETGMVETAVVTAVAEVGGVLEAVAAVLAVLVELVVVKGVKEGAEDMVVNQEGMLAVEKVAAGKVVGMAVAMVEQTVARAGRGEV